MQWPVNDKAALTNYDGETITVEQLKKRLELAEMSNAALRAKLKKAQRVSKSRLERMKQRGKLLIQERVDKISNVGGF
ncbi:hypothetical protein ACP46_gp79 [Rhizobium phage RHEph06]|uniref:Uncharacterized protein n=2 Tax=Kleczkowskavirus RHEph4 TaxID=1921526 RepID=L7TN48_9CAUD|nr:hypothetical protein ACP46_gp79 [Rhizobium phage RHEph06]YP_009598520.1 hypothetical protein FDH25_gp78 [Rhizobium phage RHEph04]AGC35840.1 hypothetical protein RHEph05_gp073 [Rhizobium phage RHEph05]QXV74872.1 hypothetical protein [Rhizobium phage RHEph26]AGC35764.1 hypothetical protein RHEph04_gp078 [Rhizobium phage RHEph04]AGC35921.1 hypothetical protein RHEph06_gp079 [Rhizobium phage RHEph06]